MTDFDFSPAYTADGWAAGIAWRVDRYAYADDDLEQYEWSGIHEYDRTRVVAHMIGDDQPFDLDVDDLTPLGDRDYCRECGQVGCGCCVYE